MRFFFITFISLIFLLFVGSGIFFSTVGLNTKKFNSLIIDQIKKKEPSINIEINKIKIKLNIKDANIYLSTKNPSVNYQDVNLPINNIKIFINLFSLLDSKPKIESIVVAINELNINDFKKIITRIKPSNFKSFFLNNIQKGFIKGDFEVMFSKESKIIDYKTNGEIKKMNINILNKFNITNTNFNFIADKDLILINGLSADFRNIKTIDGYIDIKTKDNLIINGEIKTSIDTKNGRLKELLPNNKNLKILNNKIKLQGSSVSKFNLNFSKSLELTEYNFNLNGQIHDSQIILNDKIKSAYLKNKISKLNFDKTNVRFNLSKNKDNSISINGLYNLDNKNYEKFEIENTFNKSGNKFNLNFDFNEEIILNFLNYKKNKKKTANISSKFLLNNKKINIYNIDYKEGKNIILFEDIKIKNKKFKSLKKVKVKTYFKNKENNNFEINFNKKIFIKGLIFDSTNLLKQLTVNNKENPLRNINSDIEIKFKNIITKKLTPLSNFNLIGKIEKGKFIQLSSKSEFEKNKYLDISLKKDFTSGKKALEIFSDMPGPLLADFSFFDALQGGKLLFSNVFDDSNSFSNLTIDNFKVKDAPILAKLLSLADLGGVSDLMKGEGISFDKLEVKFNQKDKLLNIKEIYAVGTSISILMDGYVDNNTGMISLSGTMVPAKKLNKLISKIPLIGKILIPKEIGEGLFGVSFKIKGMSGSTKISVNPIKTLTPRFITKALEKRRKIN